MYRYGACYNVVNISIVVLIKSIDIGILCGMSFMPPLHSKLLAQLKNDTYAGLQIMLFDEDDTD